MSEPLTHECGLALIRLKHPLWWYQERHGDPLWGARRLYLLMEKQHNRGQDGAGVGCVRFDMPPGDSFLERERCAKRNPIERLFDEVLGPARKMSAKELAAIDPTELKRLMPLVGEIMMGHLRYGTHGGRTAAACHPHVRRSSLPSKTIALAGNFNMTNSRELFEILVGYGLNPAGVSDTGVVLEKVAYNLDKEHERLASSMGPGSFRNLEGRELAEEIASELDYGRIIRGAAERFDGGYVLAGLVGSGDCFVVRDPCGIRPAFMVETEECIAVASERAALMSVLNVPASDVRPVEPGHVLAIRRSGETILSRFAPAQAPRECTFERIYFSRGNDPDIYEERKRLGRNLAPRVLELLGGDLSGAVFSFIPNTSETAFLGLVEEVERLAREARGRDVWAHIQQGKATEADIASLVGIRARVEKVAHKDQRLRTFITHDAARRDLVAHVYDITRGTATESDTLVVVDDSIVRGTTLRESVITMLARLNPRRIIVASSAPPIMYPDCYGIDMSQLGRFIAFEAAVSLIRQRGQESILRTIETDCESQESLPVERLRNAVRKLYDAVSFQDLCDEVARLSRPSGVSWKGELHVIYQTVEGLRAAMPSHTGDWYFTGEYPTPGGFQTLNRAYLDWCRKIDRRSYE
ncbi:MAG: amidophosphoribosyltransferase [Planctomycetota bacterium]|nr:amidophosphoribosyltransferase [Planctomycetota bacterium]MDA1105978.1 amidophosphoribosyltransferase [Planctomycetota bacterium]